MTREMNFFIRWKNRVINFELIFFYCGCSETAAFPVNQIVNFFVFTFYFFTEKCMRQRKFRLFFHEKKISNFILGGNDFTWKGEETQREKETLTQWYSGKERENEKKSQSVELFRSAIDSHPFKNSLRSIASSPAPNGWFAIWAPNQRLIMLLISIIRM